MKVKFLIVWCIISCTTAKDWWENGNFYQIYPRSFKDSNGDGVGDLMGITEKLQYIKDLGVDATWLSPIFKSPMVDFGYDIADYYQIHYEFGTLDDFDNLVKKAKEIGLKIILDLVPNHTSDDHEWFQKSVQREGKYENYYVWHDGIKDPANPTARPKPPNNWVSAFRYSAWEWNDVRQQYYLHQFAIRQPDLNYRDENVVEEVKDVIRFWLSKGVSGFRIDAVPFMFEIKPDSDGNYMDEPVNANCPDPDDYCHTQHIYTNDQPETYDMIFQWRAILDEFKILNGGDTRVILTEAYTSLTNMVRFYGDETRNGSHVPFNFQLMSNSNNASTAKDYSDLIDSWIKLVPEHQYPNWVMGNHDSKRLASRMGRNRADLFNMMLQTLPGIAVTYNGEEIAMTNVYIKWEDTVDPQACNTDPEVFDDYSRDPERTPFQWDASKSAGFSSSPSTWLPVSEDYKSNNVLMQQRAPVSHLSIFQKLTKLRDEPSMASKELEKVVTGNDILVYKRELSGSDAYIIVLNFGTEKQTVNLKSIFSSIGDRLEVITTSVHADYKDGDVVQSSSAVAYPEAGTVFVVIN